MYYLQITVTQKIKNWPKLVLVKLSSKRISQKKWMRQIWWLPKNNRHVDTPPPQPVVLSRNFWKGIKSRTLDWLLENPRIKDLLKEYAGQGHTQNFAQNTVFRSLMPLGLRTQRDIKGPGFFRWNELLPTGEDCLELSKRELIKNYLILRTDYEYCRTAIIAVFKLFSRMSGEKLASFFMQYEKILVATSDNLNGVWNFDIMLVWMAFDSVPKCLEFCSRKMMVIVTERRLNC